MDNNTILVIDDDRNILSIIELYLKKAGFNVVTCATGYDALSTFRSVKPTLVVLDVMLPGRDGWSGADDYIAKPFDSNELIARIKAVLRRSAPAADQEKAIVLPDLSISLENYSVILDGIQLEMPPKEIELLYFLASHAGKVFTREQLLEQVWGFDFFGDSRTVDVHVKRIREKLGERQSWQLKTVWGVGYKFEIHS